MPIRLPPNPKQSRSIEDWADKYYQYIMAETANAAINDPRPILLAHKVDSARTSASTDGVLMYDPVVGNVTVSKGGVWLPLAYVP
tara:strand:+ start:118 stop:372 length:255 start_codon:yes stop_codon:yes gene_type:complete